MRYQCFYFLCVFVSQYLKRGDWGFTVQQKIISNIKDKYLKVKENNCRNVFLKTTYSGQYSIFGFQSNNGNENMCVLFEAPPYCSLPIFSFFFWMNSNFEAVEQFNCRLTICCPWSTSCSLLRVQREAAGLYFVGLDWCQKLNFVIALYQDNSSLDRGLFCNLFQLIIV